MILKGSHLHPPSLYSDDDDHFHSYHDDVKNIRKANVVMPTCDTVAIYFLRRVLCISLGSDTWAATATAFMTCQLSM